MKALTEIWSDGVRRWTVIARDPERMDLLIDTNEYAMAGESEILLTDPGGFEIDLLCPQHGAIYRGADVERFINWFAELEVGQLRGAASRTRAA